MSKSPEEREYLLDQLASEANVRTKRRVRFSVGLSVGLSILAASWLTFTILQVSELNNRKRFLETEVSKLEKTQQDLLNDLGWSKERLAKAQLELKTIDASLEASKARREASAASKLMDREKITVQVFSRDVDREVVAGSLRELGFHVILKQSNPNIPEVIETNAIWYGPKVGLSEVKLVALTLVRAGITLGVIEPFDNPHGRDYVIQIGSKIIRIGRIIRKPQPYSVEEIRQAKWFKE